MDIPLQFRSNMGVYDIKIHGGEVKATIVYGDDQLEKGISELRSLMGDFPLVGIDLKKSENSWRPLDLILMYVKDRCLIIQLNFFTPSPEILGNFLSDKSICFVGFEVDSHFSDLRRYLEDYRLGNGAEICKLAALVLKNPSLQKCGSLVELASKIGYDMEQVDQNWVQTDWGALVFSEEQIKYAIQEVHHSYCIGKKLLSMLG